ncbi:MAG TPA: hypothetical protein VMF06_12490 [Candidatus Limnocylindria bacterium]|nr:hypothetical protein [Candidatus Limnocylindria bacterium]
MNLGKVIFKTFDEEYEYFILEAEPQSVWTEAERQKWDLIVCTVCGSALKKKSGGGFRMKEFERSVFESGRVLIYGAEVPTFFMNEAVKDLLAKAEPKGMTFQKVGSFTS